MNALPRRRIRRACAVRETKRPSMSTRAAVLLAATGDDLDDLTASAARVRDASLAAAGRDGQITYCAPFLRWTHLCRDRCHYCVRLLPGKLARGGWQGDVPRDRQGPDAGAALGLQRALFTLGDRPGDRWPQAAQWLDERGYDSTLQYVRAAAIRVLEETGLLPHLNPA